MYRGFKLPLLTFGEDMYNLGLKVLEPSQKKIESIFNEFLLSNGYIDGSKLQENWFPQIDADIFISHSHKDEYQAIAMAGWLNNNFGIKSFVDSCIWGYGNHLLKALDNMHCRMPSGHYSYDLRNQSTSHIHMMLSSALSMMIDKTECLIFFNTPNAVIPTDIINKTESPWIYFELTISKLIEKKTPIRFINESIEKGFEHFYRTRTQKAFPIIKYNIDTNHLTNIEQYDIELWMKSYHRKYPLKSGSRNNALDILYTLFPSEIKQD